MSAYLRVHGSAVLHVRADCAHLLHTRPRDRIAVPAGRMPNRYVGGEWRLCTSCSTGGRVGPSKPAPPLSAALDLGGTP